MKKLTGIKSLILALLAFGGLGLEVLLAFFIEPLLYGTDMANWSTFQNISHWILTCICWGLVSAFIIIRSKKAYGFNVMEKKKKLKAWQVITIVIIIIISLIVSYIDWKGFKVIKEFNYNGWLKFIFQYIYYIFETLLVMLIIIFGQKAFENWLKIEKIPFGGIVLSLTWGLVHFLTKGTSTGIITTILALAIGIVYLIVNKDAKKSYLITFIIFVF